MDVIDLGLLVVGERPDALEYQFLDGNHVAIDLTNYTARFSYHEVDGVATTAAATISDPVNGIVVYAWSGTEMTTAGTYEANFWVGNNAQRYASWLITWHARLSVGQVPAI